jgi:hypothetical protein
VAAVSRRVVLVAVVAALAILAGLSLELGRSGSSEHAASTSVPAHLPGQLTGPAPWPANTGRLAPRLAVLGLPALAFEGTALHIHQHLDLFVDGRRVSVPAGIGIDPEGRFISPLHTHDTSGVIHVESTTVRPFTLAEFFGVWGVRLGPGRLGGYTDLGRRRLRVWVDGRPLTGDPGRLVLAEHQEIVLAFGTSAELPRPLPTHDAFASGL